MSIVKNPFFWAFISMFAVFLSTQIVRYKRLGKNPFFGIIIVSLFALGRVVLVLPSLPQPRINLGIWNWILGGVIFTIGIVFTIPAWKIRPFTFPDQTTVLKTDGFYAIVRNPIYLAEVLWSLGWSIMFQSVIGILLVPLWWASLFCLVLIEEDSLAQVFGQPYLDYKKKVKSRIIPGLPV
jgi:protein-S-isoprenylcysteine O-methyltransferase Ste14